MFVAVVLTCIIHGFFIGGFGKFVLTPLAQFSAEQQKLEANCRDFQGFAKFIVGIFFWNFGISLFKAAVNFFGVQYMASARQELSRKLHAMYLNPHSRCYYVLNNLDKKV